MNRELKELFNVRKNVVHTVTSNTTIKDAVDKMNIHHIGAVMVLSEEGEVEGIMSERDVMKKLATTYEDVGHLPVTSIMTPKESLIVITGDEKISEIMTVMTSKSIRHLPIIDEQGVLNGVISMRDILRMLLSDVKQEAKDLKNYVMGTYPA